MKQAAEVQELYEVTVVDGYGSGRIIVRTEALADSLVSMLRAFVSGWNGKYQPTSEGLTVNVLKSRVRSGIYANATGRAFLRWESERQKYELTLPGGDILFYDKTAQLWQYLQKNNYRLLD